MNNDSDERDVTRPAEHLDACARSRTTWRIRFSHTSDPDAPRETLVFTLTDRMAAKTRSKAVLWRWRASAKDCRGRRHGGEGATPARAIAAAVKNLVGWGRLVWVVAPPGEVLAEDGRPPVPAREPVRFCDRERLSEAESVAGTEGSAFPFGVAANGARGVPTSIITLARKAILVGASTNVCACCSVNDAWWTLEIRGSAAEALKTELREAGFVRYGSTPSWKWSPMPLAVVGVTDARASSPDTKPMKPKLRLVKTPLSEPST